MIALALNFSNLSLPKFIEECRKVTTSMAAAAIEFPTPVPTLASINAAVNTLETTYIQGLTGDHSAVELQKSQRKDVNVLMQQLLLYVRVTSGTDVSKALKSGIKLRKTPEPHTVIGKPGNVRAINKGAGGAQINWDGVPHRRSYLVYTVTDLADVLNPAKWTLLTITSKTRFVATGLMSGTKYGFIIVAAGSGTVKSLPSDPAIITVL